MKFWQVWIALVAVVSGPWYGLTAHPQWDRVTWIPFRGAEDKPRDVLANVLLYVPFGWSFVYRRPGSPVRRRSPARAVAVAAAVSLVCESAQLFFLRRDPSATDVLMALCGAAAGSLAFQTLHRFDPRGQQ